VSELMGSGETLVSLVPDARSDVATTMIYTHVLQRGARAVRSPADGLLPD
jgi:hypothetical protein